MTTILLANLVAFEFFFLHYDILRGRDTVATAVDRALGILGVLGNVLVFIQLARLSGFMPALGWLAGALAVAAALHTLIFPKLGDQGHQAVDRLAPVAMPLVLILAIV